MMNTVSDLFLAPICIDHDMHFDVRRGRNCIGMKVFEYHFSQAVDIDLLERMNLIEFAKFPLGKEGRIVKVDKSSEWLMEAILGLPRCKIILRLGADICLLRGIFEQTLVNALMEKEDNKAAVKAAK